MHNQSVNSSVSRAAQLSIFLKGKVFAPPNPFSFSKRHDGIRLELAKFFAHGFAVITSNNCKSPCSPGATVRRYYSSVSCSIRRLPYDVERSQESLSCATQRAEDLERGQDYRS
jgi:hypothetical protein